MGKLRNRTRPSKPTNDLKIKHGYEIGEQTTKVKQVTRGDDASLTKSQLNIFPSFTPVLVTTLTLIFRTWHVLQPRNWWMVHPDEVYQSVEVAHLHLYGYGFRSHEYSPPDPPLPLTKYKEVELKAGMYGLSSPLYPHFYVTVGWLVSLTGYSFSPYILWRVSHVVVSSTLPLVLYHYVCTLHKSHTAGCMAAIMAATSVHLNVLGTHCLVHSFLAPFTFFSLLLLIGNSQIRQCDGTGNSDDRGSSLVEISRRSDDEELSRCKKIAPDINGNPIKTDPNDAFQFKQKCNRNIRTSYNIRKTVWLHWQIFCASFIMGLTIYIRPDAVLVFTLHFLVLKSLRRYVFSTRVISLTFGLFFATTVGILADFCFYGIGVISPWNWFHYNVFKTLSLNIFSQSNATVFLEMTSTNGIGFLLAVSFIVEISMHISGSADVSTKKEDKGEMQKASSARASKVTSFQSFLIWTILLIAYLVCGHKEIRFFHDVFVFIFVFVSTTFVKVKIFIKNDLVKFCGIVSVLAIFSLNQWIVFPTNGGRNSSRWVYQKTEDVQDINICLHYVASQTDVTGVFCDCNLHMTGGYTLLHQDVTFMALLKGGYYEYAPKSRSKENSWAGRDLSIVEFTRASNYVAEQNALATARVIIERRNYNYVIVRTDRPFLPVGFREVFSAGNRRVFQRSFGEMSERKLQDFLDRIPLGTNATVMLHEGDVLYYMNQYAEASFRFQHALRLNSRLLEAYLPLQNCYHKLNNLAAAYQVLSQCHSMFSARECTTPRKITQL
ncbi:hypothetical protein BgiBS90_032630 [Biomphalaria glabrata]|nr:hypothetical protein BgiBS90_032630 [Biomphalaria glabrata]